ncbi:MAG: TIGR04222 domain-containing membrane protein [Gemmataceae bacterium]
MNPFDLSGPDFLRLMMSLSIPFFIVGLFLRWFLAEPDDAEMTPSELDPTEVAFLGGGSSQAMNVGLLNLLQSKSIQLDDANRTISKQESLPTNATPLEKAIYQVIEKAEGPVPLQTLQENVSEDLQQVREKLQSFGYLASNRAQTNARWIPFLWMGCLIIFAGIKVVVGLSRGKPVGFLLFGSLVFIVVSAFVFLRPIFRTSRGKNFLKSLREQHAALRSTSSSNASGLAPADLALAAGLFGMTVLAGTAYAHHEKTLFPRQTSSNAGFWGGESSCGSSSCGSSSSCGGSSCGGGGCGGCGGGGD